MCDVCDVCLCARLCVCVTSERERNANLTLDSFVINSLNCCIFFVKVYTIFNLAVEAKHSLVTYLPVSPYF